MSGLNDYWKKPLSSFKNHQLAADELSTCSRPSKTYLVDALHPALLQVCFGAQEVGVLRVIHWLLKININAICGPRRGDWMAGGERQERG